MARRVLAACGSRANWSSLRSICDALDGQPGIELEVACFASAVSDRYGSIVDEIRGRYQVVHELDTLAEGGHMAMVQTCALTLTALGNLYAQRQPDVVVIVGDRYECLPAAYAAALQNVIVAHTMSGEVSGSIDESIRHAITKLAHVHFPATEAAARRIRRMGEPHAAVHVVGCPRIDTVLANARGDGGAAGGARHGWGEAVVLCYHPVTTRRDQEALSVLTGAQQAAEALGRPLHVVWPNSDAGREGIARVIRATGNIFTHRRATPEEWARVLNTCAVLIGNSSSGLRDAAILGTPVVNVGDRQQGRECAENVVHVPTDAEAIRAAAIAQAEHGRYPSSTLYGDGTAGKRIAEVLMGKLPNVQKVWAA